MGRLNTVNSTLITLKQLHQVQQLVQRQVKYQSEMFITFGRSIQLLQLMELHFQLMTTLVYMLDSRWTLIHDGVTSELTLSYRTASKWTQIIFSLHCLLPNWIHSIGKERSGPCEAASTRTDDWSVSIICMWSGCIGATAKHEASFFVWYSSVHDCCRHWNVSHVDSAVMWSPEQYIELFHTHVLAWLDSVWLSSSAQLV